MRVAPFLCGHLELSEAVEAADESLVIGDATIGEEVHDGGDEGKCPTCADVPLDIHAIGDIDAKIDENRYDAHLDACGNADETHLDRATLEEKESDDIEGERDGYDDSQRNKRTDERLGDLGGHIVDAVPV